MIDKDPEGVSALAQFAKDALPYVTTLFLSAWGGTVSYIQQLKSKKFSIGEWFATIVVSSFVGILTYWMTVAANIESGALSAMLISISGAMGTRAMTKYEAFYTKVLGLKPDEEIKPDDRQSTN